MTMRFCNVEAEAGLLQTIDQCISDILLGPGSGHGHVQAHEPAGGPQDHGGDQEGGGQRRPAAGQLHRPDTGECCHVMHVMSCHACHAMSCHVSCPVPGAAKHGSLRGPEQPHQAAGAVPAVVRPHHGGVLPAGDTLTRAVNRPSRSFTLPGEGPYSAV